MNNPYHFWSKWVQDDDEEEELESNITYNTIKRDPNIRSVTSELEKKIMGNKILFSDVKLITSEEFIKSLSSLALDSGNL